jgi:predicted Zn-dependent peptidase
MQKYFDSRYAANNLTLVLAGNFDWENAKAQAESLCGEWNTADSPRELPDYPGHQEIYVTRPRDEAGKDKFNRAHIALMAPGFAAQNAQRHAALVACEAVGAGDGSRLYWALVHPGVAEAAQIGHDSNDGAGAYYGYVLADPMRAQESLDVFRKVIEEACRDGLKDEEVERAKRRLASHMVISAETPMGRLRPVGMNWLYRKEQIGPEESLQRVLGVTTQQVNEVLAARPFERATIVGLGPLDALK